MIIRSCLFLILWIIWDGWSVMGLWIGVPCAILAALVSMRLLPPAQKRNARICLLGLGCFIAQFLWNSIKAGWEVAYWAFHPRLPLRTGFVVCACEMPVGNRRDLFLVTCSLMPGSLPIEDVEEGKLLLHCLNTDQPVCQQMHTHEMAFMRIWKSRKT